VSWERAERMAFRTPHTCEVHGTYEAQIQEGLYQATCPECNAASSSLPTGVVAPPGHDLVVCDRFDLTFIDMNESGARLLVQPLTRPEAQAMVRRYQPPVYSGRDWENSNLESELGVEMARPRVAMGRRVLVMQRVGFREFRFYLVTYTSDGDGCV